MCDGHLLFVWGIVCGLAVGLLFDRLRSKDALSRLKSVGEFARLCTPPVKTRVAEMPAMDPREDTDNKSVVVDHND